MSKLRFVVPVLFMFLLQIACKKDSKIDARLIPAPTPIDTTPKIPTLTFDMKAFVNGSHLKDSAWYLNFYADSFTVRRLDYYISNVKLKRSDGFIFAEPESYHLIKHMEGKEDFNILSVPEGVYTAIEFIIGVDSTRNVSGVQSGALDITNGMFWEWNTGYIFLKFEGDCRVAGDPDMEDFGYHIGGFTGKNNCLQKCSFTLANPLIASNGKKTTVFYHVNVEEIFKNPFDLDIVKIYQSGGQLFKSISDNYQDMFKVDHVQN